MTSAPGGGGGGLARSVTVRPAFPHCPAAQRQGRPPTAAVEAQGSPGTAALWLLIPPTPVIGLFLQDMRS